MRMRKGDIQQKQTFKGFIMKTKILALLTALAFLCSMGTAPASMIIYDEATDGDLDARGTTNVDLVAGENIINGVINATPPADSDQIYSNTWLDHRKHHSYLYWAF